MATLRQEYAFAKKGRCTSRKRRVEVRVIARHPGEFPVRLMRRVLKLSVAGFSAYCRRPGRGRAVSDDVVMARVRTAFVMSGET